jgi:hypothetical protein
MMSQRVNCDLSATSVDSSNLKIEIQLIIMTVMQSSRGLLESALQKFV